MAASVEALSNAILSRLGAGSLTEVAATLPSALTTDVYISAAKKELEKGHIEEAFHQLSLSHSSLLHHRMAQRLYKPSRNTKDDEQSAPDVQPASLSEEKITIATTNKEETIGLLQKLPSNWTVVQITTQDIGENKIRKIDSSPPTPALYIAKCSCGPSPVITVQSVRAPRDEGVRSIIQEVELIKQENKIINRDYRDQQQKYVAKREELNNRLKCVVRSMEVAWIGRWCCLLTGSLEPREHKMLEDTMRQILSSCSTSLTENQKMLLQCIVSCPLPSEKHKDLGPGPTFNIPSAVAAVLGESVRNQQVKELCSLINKEETKLSQIRQAERNPVILVLDKSIVSLPWEMIWILRDQPVTRMPSLRMLTLLYQHHSSRSSSVLVQGVDTTRTSYLLDPDNNLPRTQDRLKGLLAVDGWQGITGTRPTHDQFKESLTNYDMFVYVGHGSGSQYLPGDLVEGIECRALVLLYGCSSARLAPRGRIPDPWGVVLNYLIAYCPCVVGMLWDVTDRDTDNLTKEMLRALRGENGAQNTPLATPPSDLALLVAQARSLCRLYLTAAALTVYGLPLHVISSQQDD